MPALHTAFRLVLESQHGGAAPRRPGHAGDPGPSDPRGENAAGTDPEPARSSSDRSAHTVSR